MLSEKLIKDMLDKALKISNPDRIILFGSQTRSDKRIGSDIDLAFKGINSEKAAEIKEVLNEEMETLTDFDVLAFDEIENKSLKERIVKEGKTIYERNAK